MSHAQLLQLFFSAEPYLFGLVIVPLLTWLITKLPSLQQPRIRKIVAEAVQAVEQIGKQQTDTLDAAGKKALALTFAQQLLAAAHINVPVGILDMLIESAVYLLKQQQLATFSVTTPATDSVQSANVTPVSVEQSMGPGATSPAA